MKTDFNVASPDSYTEPSYDEMMNIFSDIPLNKDFEQCLH